MMRKKISLIILLMVIFLTAIFYFIYGWKIPIAIKIENLNLPDGYEIVYETKIEASDVYWPHVKGEKVIKCDLGYEAAKEYIETHNSEKELQYISICPYEGMSDIAIYDSEFDEEFWLQPDKDNYVKISYLKRYDNCWNKLL